MYKFIVYKVTNIDNGKIYIGLTSSSLIKRKREHYNKKSRPGYFPHALKKHPENVFTWEEIAHCKTKQDAGTVEQLNIALYQTTNSDFGYNLTKGGEGTLGRSPWNKGKPMLPHVKLILDAKRSNRGFTGGKHTEETRKILSQKILTHVKKLGHGVMKGFKHTPETRLKMSRAKLGSIPANKGKKMSQEYNAWVKSKIVTNKQLIVTDLYSGFSMYFNSITDASIQLKITRNKIHKYLYNKAIHQNFDFTLNGGI